MIKPLATLISAVFVVASFAHAQPRESLADRAQKIANQLQAVQSKISYREEDSILRSLEVIEYILSHYRSYAGDQLSCVSNGSSGVFEKFYITDLDTGNKIGGETSLNSCREVIESKSHGMICLSNGSSGVFEKFTPFDVKSKKLVGSETNLKSCLELVSNASDAFICASNGNSGVFEKFYLLNRETGRTIGGETSRENCLASVPRY